MAIHQAWLDECEKEIREQFLKELTHYHHLQRLSQCKGVLQIWGQYVDTEDNRLCQAFLGGGRWPSAWASARASAWASALQCVKHVISFL